MFELSEAAQKELEAYFEGKERAMIRVFLTPGGCSGPRLALAIDDAGDDDATEEVAGFKFCINKNLLEQIKSAKIDLTPLGFMVEPEIPLPDMGGGSCCSGCSGCGSN